MKAFGIIGASVLRKAPFTERLIEAYRIDGLSVSVIKHAPDGFDIDTPGKVSHARRAAGASEVMLVGDRRLVLMSEYRERGEPRLDALIARLAPVDLVIVEGFRDSALPTLEIHLPSRGRAPRWPESSRIVAVASDEVFDAPVARFALDDVGAIADFMIERASRLRVP